MSFSVLLVEDDRAIATVVSEALGEEGYRVTACTSIARRDALLAEVAGDFAGPVILGEDLMVFDVGKGVLIHHGARLAFPR